MQVITCPKCKTENKPTNASCSNCYASLEGVTPGESTKASTPVAKPSPTARPAAPKKQTPPVQTPAARPVAAPGPIPPRPSVPLSTERVTAPGYRPLGEPVKLGPSPWAIVLLLVLVAGAISAALLLRTPVKKTPPAVPADQVVLKFLEAKKTGNVEKVKPFLSEASVRRLDTAFSSRQARSAGIERKDVADMFLFSVPPTKEMLASGTVRAEVLKNKDPDLEIAIVRVILSRELPGIDMPDTTTEFSLVIENSQWKVDLAKSAQRNMGKEPML